MPFIDGKSIFLICALIGFAKCEPHKIIKSITPTVIRSVGEEAILTCGVENLSDYSVLWSKKNKDDPSNPFPISFLTRLTVKDPRFNLTLTSNSYSLHIRNIEYNDAALYECSVLLSEKNKESKIVELLIRHPPKISQVIEITPPVASVGGTAELNCTANGYPRPTISWARENNGILPLPEGGHLYNRSILKITNVSKEDRGLYYCIADNGIEGADRRSVNFEVEFPPKIYVPRPRVAQALDYDIELECRVEGFPSPSVIWNKIVNGKDGKKEAERIETGSDYSITTTATVNSISTSILRVITIEQSQYGLYECKAENKLGVANETAEIYDSLVAVYPWQAIGQQQTPNINYSGLQWNASTSLFIPKSYIRNLIAFYIALTFLY